MDETYVEGTGADFLGKSQAPLTPTEWAMLERAAMQAARERMVTRRALDLYGPLGAGVTEVHTPHLADEPNVATVSVLGEEEEEPFGAHRPGLLPLLVLQKDFLVHFRDLERSRQLHVPIENELASAAGAAVALAEDRLVLHGDGRSVDGLLTVEGASEIPFGDLNAPGSIFNAAVRGIERLIGASLGPPFALVVAPNVFGLLHRVSERTGTLEATAVRDLLGGPLLTTPAMPEGRGVLVAASSDNLDVAVGIDLSLAFLETTGMAHRFRVLESIALRIKRPAAIVRLS